MWIRCFFIYVYCLQFLSCFQPSDVVFKLIKKHSNNCGNPYTIHDLTLHNHDFRSKKTAVLIHGWKPPGAEVQSYKKLCDCISKDADDVENIIIVDWSSIAGAFPNATSSETQNIEYTAQQLANLLDKLEKNNGLDLSNVDLIGHSLGVYVAGLTGSYLLERNPAPISALNGERLNDYNWVATQLNVPKFCGVPGYDNIFPSLNHYIDCHLYPSTNTYHIHEALTPLCAKPVGNIVGLDPAGPNILSAKNKKSIESVGQNIIMASLTMATRMPKLTITSVFSNIAANYLVNQLPTSLESSRFSLTGNEAQHVTQYVSDPKLLGVPETSLDKSREFGGNVVVVGGDHGSLVEPHSKIVDWYCQSIKKCQFQSQNSNDNLGYNYVGRNAGALHHIDCSITSYDDPNCCKEDKKPSTPSCVPSRNAELTDKLKQDFNITKF